MKLHNSILVAIVLIVFSAGPSFAGKPLRFLWSKAPLLPGHTRLESCNARYGAAFVYGVRRGKGNTVQCRVRFESALNSNRVFNFKPNRY